MMNLHQMQLAYQADQDRILFRISLLSEDKSKQEIRAWLTRRIVRNLWTGLIKALETQVALDQPQAAHAKSEIVGMAHQSTVTELASRGDFKAAFQENAEQYPIGEEPILINAAHFTLHARQALRINFTPAQGQGFEIAFQAPILHGFCSLLQKVVKEADWGMELNLPGSAPDTEAPRTLN